MTEHGQHHSFKTGENPFQEISDPAVLSKDPMVSVKMMTYNHEPYIAQAIEGVLMQKTNFHFELIIGEDCSADGTREIVFDYQKKYPDIIRVITSEKNVGSRKNSLRTSVACRGRYVAFCEGDDFWLRDDKLQMQVDYLEKDMECGLVHGEIDLINEFDGKLTKRYHQSQHAVNTMKINDLFYEIFIKRYLIRTCTVCLRNDLYWKVVNSEPEVFKTGRFMMNDTPLWLELSRICKFHYIDKSLAVYRKHEGGVSGFKEKEKFIKFELSIFDMLMYYLKKYNYTNRVPKSFLYRFYNNVLGYAFDEMDVPLAEKVVNIGGRLSPKLLFLYYGSKNRFVNKIIGPLVRLKRSI